MDMRKIRVPIRSVNCEELGSDYVFTLGDFMGDPSRVKKVLEDRGIVFSEEQIKSLKEIFSSAEVIDPIGPVAGVYETCGPTSRTKVCF